LYLKDGTCPSDNLIESFFETCNNPRGAIAVHCMAGLGRTGTFIGLYAMKYHQMPAESFIGWTRICRPGSVIGAQQNFLIVFVNF
jgi:cell division cycle 14